MSFDVFFFAFDKGDFRDAPRECLLEALAGVVVESQGDGWYRLTAADGGSVTAIMHGLAPGSPLNPGATFHLRGWTPGVLAILFRLASTCGMSMIATAPSAGFIVTSEDHLGDLPQDVNLVPPMVVRSSEELQHALFGGVDAWRRYRDQVVAGR